MEAYWRLGDRTEAIRQYFACREAVVREFNIGPSRRTHELFEQIKNGERTSMRIAATG
jgi:hypothetical protein